MKAAEAMQSAQFSSDWESVKASQDEAINNLRLIKKNSPDYEIARAKIEEYSNNRDYAQERAIKAEPSTLFSRAQICKAAISSIIGSDPSIMKADSQAKGVVFLSYIR